MATNVCSFDPTWHLLAHVGTEKHSNIRIYSNCWQLTAVSGLEVHSYVVVFIRISCSQMAKNHVQLLGLKTMPGLHMFRTPGPKLQVGRQALEVKLSKNGIQKTNHQKLDSKIWPKIGSKAFFSNRQSLGDLIGSCFAQAKKMQLSKRKVSLDLPLAWKVVYGCQRCLKHLETWWSKNKPYLLSIYRKISVLLNLFAQNMLCCFEQIYGTMCCKPGWPRLSGNCWAPKRKGSGLTDPDVYRGTSCHFPKQVLRMIIQVGDSLNICFNHLDVHLYAVVATAPYEVWAFFTYCW